MVSADEFIEVEEEPDSSASLAQAIDAEVPEVAAPADAVAETVETTDAVADPDAVGAADAVEDAPDAMAATEQPDLPATDETSEEEN